MKHRLRFLPFSFIALAICAGCVAPQKKPVVHAKPTPAPVRESYWKGEGVKGPAAITINITEQRAYFYLGGQLVGESTISSGRKGFETPPGHYKVIQKDKDHVSNLYGDYVDENGEIVKKNVDASKDPKPEGAEFKGASMPFFLRFTGGYGMHAGYLPGYRASHGCVRMPKSMAEHFFEAATEGMPVTVVESEPASPVAQKPAKWQPFFKRSEDKRGTVAVSTAR